MNSQVSADIKIYHIMHLDRLSSLIKDGVLWSDAKVHDWNSPGTTIGFESIKEHRLTKALVSYKDLNVGGCVPFYFCPRSIMLYIFYQNNHPNLTYKGGQKPIIHLVADFQNTIEWAKKNSKRWVFTDCNARASYCNDYKNLDDLNKIDWTAVRTDDWKDCKEPKQAEFLLEDQFPFELIESIGVYSENQQDKVLEFLGLSGHKPPVKIMKNWYY